MKKIFCCSFFILLLACDDGDLQIETLDFDSATIQVCDNNPVEAYETNLLFKLNDTEALILELPATALKNEVSVEQIDLSVSASGPTKITYRTFSDQVAKTYFCSEVPVTEPTVLSEIIASGGSVFINTVMGSDSTKFEHTITFSEISLLTSEDVRITDLNIDNFGTVSTTLSD